MESLAEGLEILLQLLAAILIGALIGWERQMHGRWADLRTHMMVSMGAAIFTLAALGVATTATEHTTRVIQGIAAGIASLIVESA